METVVVYYSYSGNNDFLAKEIGERFGCDIVQLEEQKKRSGLTIALDLLFKRDSKLKDPDVRLNDYETIIFIAPIWDAKIATPLSSYLKKERENINSYAFITVCGGRPDQKQKITDQLQRLIGKKAIAVTELAVNELLPPEKKNKIEYVTPYRIKDNDFDVFKTTIQNFVNTVFRYSVNHAEERVLMKM